ncbi:hypothetical protein RUM43_011379 [Polyplax serrata]|uniref:DNA 5'-3' helicase n=1 Tax=Polyplax serrata TaxID=468196 RepID=A0AAN8PUK4_POLSC
MEVEETVLETPSDFPFPFTPYSIQKDLMRNLYNALEGKKLGIFESPTGTGKSMSLICGSLTWLLDAQKRTRRDVESGIKKLSKELQNVNQGKDWLEEHAALTKIRQNKDGLQDLLNKIVDMENRLTEIDNKAKKINVKYARSDKYNLLKSEQVNDKENRNDAHEVGDFDDCDILLDDYSGIEKNMNYDKYDYLSDSDGEPEQVEKYRGIKVFLCSRTHSQLSQLVGEIQKSPFKDMKIRVVSLASRQNFCINDSVLNLKHLPLINERCQDLHNKKKGKTTKASGKGESLKRQKTTRGCPFYNQSGLENLKLKTLTEILNVEEMVHNGNKLNACPYYASRYAVDDAQIIIVPYNTILHKETRQAYGIDLKGSVVIIDEAHNLLDTIENIHSCTVSGYDLVAAYSQLVQYRDKFSERFTPLNLLHLNQLIFIVNKLLKRVGGKGGGHPNTAIDTNQGITLETLAEFLLSTEIDTINFYKVLEFTTKSNIVNKLRGFVDKYRPSVVIHKKSEEKGVAAFLKKMTTKVEEKHKEQENDPDEIIRGNPLLSVVTFVQSLTNHCLDGRVVCTLSKTVGTSSLKFLLLNSASHFSDIVRDARSVILAGGTMQPVSEFTDQLFHLAGGTSDRISVFTCGHIIPEENILPITVSTGPSGKSFDFSYQSRSNLDIVDELGRLLINVCNVVPAGVVCFFPSYEYESFVYQHFDKTKVIQRLECKKKVVREPKKSTKVDEILRMYGRSVAKCGALLFSVVGGKLSEGLNFNDDLGRCVIVVGLPYPNLTSPELKEKMNYLNSTVGPTAGKTYYENLCMKAVNQSIGRSVRHKGDYASVLLVDQRFSRSKCCQALPEWIQRSLRKEEKFGGVMKLLGRFFASKKQLSLQNS